jgi:phosphatidate cytidylyltransferase
VTRSISGLLFMVLIIGSLMMGVISYGIVFCIITAIMMKEYLDIVAGKKGMVFQKIIAIATGISLFVSLLLIFSNSADIIILSIPLLLLILLYISNLYIKQFNIHEFEEEKGLQRRKANGYELFPSFVNGILYIALPMSLISLTGYFTPDPSLFTFSGSTLISFFIIIWASDVGAFCFGSAIGQKFGPKLFPSVSPKKSWVGMIGGLACAIVAGWILSKYTTLFDFSIIDALILSAIINIGGAFGDLVESQLKRNFGVKDSGTIMPGHGGMLDRFDSVLIGFPLAIIYIKLLIV